MKNLDELKEKLIEIFKSDKNEYFENVKNTLSKYNGNDWIKYIKINDKSYNRHVYFSSNEFDLIVKPSQLLRSLASSCILTNTNRIRLAHYL